MSQMGNAEWPQKPSWGNGIDKSPARPSSSVPKKEEEEPADKECSICFDADISVYFSPCNHGACTDCVTKLRREVIFKADKGMKCPFCRQYIEHHRTAGTTGDSKAKQALKDANQSAKMAALARQSSQQQRRVTDPEPEGRPDQKWQCSKCKEDNSFSAKMCGRCRQVAPSFVLAQLSSARGPAGDVLKANPKMLQNWARIKLHPNFNAAFAELGMPFDMQSAQLLGTEETVMTAIKAGHYKKVHRILDAILADNDVKELTFDFYGNYTLQDIILLVSRMRDAANKLLNNNQINSSEHAIVLGSARNKYDYFRRITNQIAAVADTALLHAQGNYVIEKIVEFGTPPDVLTVTNSLFEKPWNFFSPKIMHSKYALVKAVRAVDRLNVFAFEEGPHQEECSAHLNKLCGGLLADPNLFNRLLLNDLGGTIILDAAQGGLSNPHAQTVLTRIAKTVRTLRSSNAGVSVLKRFMSLESRNEECRETFITHVCIMAQELDPEYAETASAKGGSPEIIQRMLELLSQEIDPTHVCDEWVSHIVSILVANAETLIQDPSTEELLSYGLSLPEVAQLAPDFLQQIKETCGVAKWKAMKAAVNTKSGGYSATEEQSTSSMEPPDPTPFDMPSPSSPKLPAQSSSVPIISPPQEEDLTGFTTIGKGGKKNRNASGTSVRSNTSSLELETLKQTPHVSQPNSPRDALQKYPSSSSQPAKKSEPYQIPHKKIKNLQGSTPPEDAKNRDSPSLRAGDTSALASWRAGAVSNTKSEGPTAASQAPPPSKIQPDKIQRIVTPPPEPVESNDFANDFLADLLPGLRLGGPPSPKPGPKAVEPAQKQKSAQLEDRPPGKMTYKPYIPVAQTILGQEGLANGSSSRPAYNPMATANASQQPANGFTMPPPKNGVIVTPAAPTGIKPASKSVKAKQTSLKANAEEFQPTSFTQEVMSFSQKPKQRGTLSVDANIFQPSNGSGRMNGKSASQQKGGKAGLKADAPAFQPRNPSGGLSRESSRVNSSSSLTQMPTINKQGVQDGSSWSCPFCTYRHEGAEAGFLACALCLQSRP